MGFVAVELIQGLRVVAEQCAGQDETQRADLPRIEPVIQQRGKGEGFGRGENRFPRQQNALYAARFQRFCHHYAFVKRPDQDGNVARNDRPVFEFQTTLGSFVERVGDFVGAIFGGTAAQDVFVEYFVVFAI